MDALPYLALLRAGFCLPPMLPPARCALTAPFHPYLPSPAHAFRRSRASARRYIFCATFLRVAPTGRYPAHCPAEFGLSSRLRPAGESGRSSGLLRLLHCTRLRLLSACSLRASPPRKRLAVSEPRRGESNGDRLCGCDADIIAYRSHFQVLGARFVFSSGFGVRGWPPALLYV